MEVAHLAVEEVLPDMSEVQSPTLMIQGYWVCLLPRRKLPRHVALSRRRKVQVPHLEKKISRMRGILARLKLPKNLIEQDKTLPTELQDQNPIIVDESTLEEGGRGFKEDVALEMEDEVQIIPPPVP